MKHLAHVALIVVWIGVAWALQVVGWGGAVIPLAILGVGLEIALWCWLIYLKRQRRLMALQQGTS